MEPTEKQVEDVLSHNVFHPEFGANVVDLGLIYDIKIDNQEINVIMTTPNPRSSKAGSLAGDVEAILTSEFEDMMINVSLTWEPEWNPSMITDKEKINPSS